eukprot:CAMPEP_0194279892 /NCGR_PEP_ID=MMETSP0169-20130528/14184_1 /TAXON_ID=218684 /ORGANISM="Corethron pennatum, Strain L29A3" /LENGTH=1078 /DNA_ID=CAMNT_0039024375 /DNA_START=227 /DNA_END=3463 /DNA_ORIENTATION=+
MPKLDRASAMCNVPVSPSRKISGSDASTPSPPSSSEGSLPQVTRHARPDRHPRENGAPEGSSDGGGRRRHIHIQQSRCKWERAGAIAVEGVPLARSCRYEQGRRRTDAPKAATQSSDRRRSRDRYHFPITHRKRAGSSGSVPVQKRPRISPCGVLRILECVGVLLCLVSIGTVVRLRGFRKEETMKQEEPMAPVVEDTEESFILGQKGGKIPPPPIEATPAELASEDPQEDLQPVSPWASEAGESRRRRAAAEAAEAAERNQERIREITDKRHFIGNSGDEQKDEEQNNQEGVPVPEEDGERKELRSKRREGAGGNFDDGHVNADEPNVSGPGIPYNMIFVTKRIPGDAKMDSTTLENIRLWQAMYLTMKFKVHFFSSKDSIESFINTKSPDLLPAYKNCVDERERFDFARLIITYHMGGISVDPEVSKPLKKMDFLMNRGGKDQFVVGMNYFFQSDDDHKVWGYPRRDGLATHVFMVTPRHPTLLAILHLVRDRLLDRDDVDRRIHAHGYPAQVLGDGRKATLLRRMWTTGSGSFSDICLAKGTIEGMTILPMAALMSTHPSGMRFHVLQDKSAGGVVQNISGSKSLVMYDESHLAVPHHITASLTYLVGAVRDAAVIERSVFEYLMVLSCKYSVLVHIVTGGGITECLERHNKLANELYPGHKCGKFDVVPEPNDMNQIPNRVDRIAYLRDFQREHLRVLLEGGKPDDVVMVADLDLYTLPPASKLMHEVERMVRYHENDVLCANGIMHHPFGYYDIFATVLLPDTFLYPVELRLIAESWEGEELDQIRSFDEYGEHTQWDTLDWFYQQGEEKRLKNVINKEEPNPLVESRRPNNGWESSSSVPVASCFGGLAIYSAPKLLEVQCRYNLQGSAEALRLIKYANKDDERPCEHVVFHDCLRRTNPNTVVAVQPDMRTQWNQARPSTDRLFSHGDKDSLITFYQQRNRGSRLEAGRFSLRINEMGKLVVETCASSLCLIPEVHWENSERPVKNNWSHMFLILEKDGNLVLIKQVPKSRLRNPMCEKAQGYSCRIVIWSSKATGRHRNGERYELVLLADGSLVVRNRENHSIIWKNDLK